MPRLTMAIGSRATSPPAGEHHGTGTAQHLAVRREGGGHVSRRGALARRGAEEGVVEEADHAALVLLGVTLEPLHVIDVVDGPEVGARSDQPLVERVHRLSVASVRRPDEQGRTRRDPVHDVDQARRLRLVGEQGDPGLLRHEGVEAADHRPRREVHELLAEGARAGALRDDRGQPRVLGGSLEHELAADGEAETPDACRVDVRPALEEVERGLDVPRATPAQAVAVAVAVALATTVEEQDPVAVLDEHPGVRLGVRAARERDHGGAVGRRHVPALELQAVARGQDDVLVGCAQVGLGDRRAHRVGHVVAEGERGNDLG